MDSRSVRLQKKSSLDKWRCPKCEFDNLALLSTCQICEAPKQFQPHLLSQGRIPTQKEGVQCPRKNCKQFNSLFDEICSKCGQSLFDDEPSSTVKKAQLVAFVNCPQCSFPNAAINEVCVSCEQPMSQKPIRTKPARKKKAPRFKARAYGTQFCDKCGAAINTYDPITGQLDPCAMCVDDQPVPSLGRNCIFCQELIPQADWESHQSTCTSLKKYFTQEGSPTWQRCTRLQVETMFYMQRKCEKLHWRNARKMEERVKKLGYKSGDLENLHHYIVNYAPIIIHMHVNTHFHFFLNDTHYRNQFQTSKSSGTLSHSARIGWQDRMFDKRHHDATGFERVKYGTMNFTNDPKGVNACQGYGQSYFLLKPHVRDRCTITDMDSAGANATLGTFRSCFHVLNKLTDIQLKAAFEGSKGMEMKSNVIGTYKEIQIHGPVQFSKDIERVYVSKNELKQGGDAQKLLEMVKSFCSKHNIDYQIFQHSPLGYSGGFGALAVAEKVDERIVGDKKELTEEDLKPPPPVAPHPPSYAFGGFGLFAPPAALPSFSFGIGAGFGGSSIFSSPLLPKKTAKRPQYGKDYI